MRLLIEIAAAALLVVCITASSAAFAAGKPGRSADGLSCGFDIPQNASPAPRCAGIKRQCGVVAARQDADEIAACAHGRIELARTTPTGAMGLGFRLAFAR